MGKARMNITVDLEVVLAAKTKPGFNVSSACNDFLRTALSIDEYDEDEAELVKELEHEKLLRKESDKRISSLIAKIQASQAQKDKERNELLQKAILARRMDESGADPRKIPGVLD